MLAVLSIHCGSTWNWARQQTFPVPTFHNSQMSQAVYAMVLAGHSRLERLPPESAYQVPGDEPGIGRWGLLKGCLDPRNDDTNYFVVTSLFLLLSSLLALVLGLEPVTLLAGTAVPAGVLMAVTFGVARRLTDRWTATAAAVLVALLPVTMAGTRTAFPSLGLMIAPAAVVAALFASDRFRRIGWVLLAAYLTALIPRWGESAGDALRAYFAVGWVVVVLGVPHLLRGTRSRKAGLLGLLAYLASSAVLVDIRWLYIHATGYVAPHMSEGVPLSDLLSPGRVLAGVLGYLTLAASAMMGWLATILVVVGVATLFVGWFRKADGEPNDPEWRIHVAAVSVWCVLPLLLISAPFERQTFYAFGGIPPLVVLAVAGLRRTPKIGRFLPWVGVLLLVPTFVAVNSPSFMRRWIDTEARPGLSTATAQVIRFAISGSAVNLYAPSTPGQFGIMDTPGLGLHLPRLEMAGGGAGLPEEVALSWATSGELRAFLESLPNGNLVVACTSELTPFGSIGAVLQATYPNLVFRHYRLGKYDHLPITNCDQNTGWDPACGVVYPQRESVYIVTFRELGSPDGAPRPPRRLGTAVQIARGSQMALYRLIAPPR